MSIKLEDLIHTVSSERDWNIVDYDSYEHVTVYKGDIDKMPMDVYFAVKDMYVLACGEWEWPDKNERTFTVNLTADPNSPSMIGERYRQRMELKKMFSGKN